MLKVQEFDGQGGQKMQGRARCFKAIAIVLGCC